MHVCALCAYGEQAKAADPVDPELEIVESNVDTRRKPKSSVRALSSHRPDFMH